MDVLQIPGLDILLLLSFVRVWIYPWEQKCDDVWL